MNNPRSNIRAVVFDLGGVVLGSPLHAIADYEREHDIPDGFINRHVVASAPRGAWHRLERGEVDMGEEFFEAFDQELEEAGQPISTQRMMERIAEFSQPREQMLRAIERLSEAGFIVAALTNNWNRSDQAEEGSPNEGRQNERSPDERSPDERSSDERSSVEDSTEHYKSTTLKRLFDHFIESSVVGLRKPDPEIYRLTCRTLGVEPHEIAFLDDIGSNLKSARALGFTTIKVDDPDQALIELEAAVGLRLTE